MVHYSSHSHSVLENALSVLKLVGIGYVTPSVIIAIITVKNDALNKLHNHSSISSVALCTRHLHKYTELNAVSRGLEESTEQLK